jgi:ABC-type multidrug transport system ATPase subunit
VIEIEGLTKRYGDKTAVDQLSFVVEPGVVTGFLGPNGAGKSTTMRMIAGLDRPTSGTVRVLLKSLAAEGRTVFVSSHLMSEMAQTATQLVVLGRGKLISEASVEDFTGHATTGGVLVRTPETMPRRQ